jgi:hypothetical protein
MAKRKGVNLMEEIRRMDNLYERLNYQFGSIGPDKRGVEQIVKIMVEGSSIDKSGLIKFLNGMFCSGSPKRLGLLKSVCEKYGYPRIFSEMEELGLFAHSKMRCKDLVEKRAAKIKGLKDDLEKSQQEIKRIAAAL